MHDFALYSMTLTYITLHDYCTVLMYCRNICETLFPQLHKNCSVLEFIIMCNGLGISCHSIIKHLNNFTLTVNMYTLTENGAHSKL